MEYSNFDEYPHKIFATAFLVNGELADYKICNHKRNWDERTFRGTSWESVATRIYRQRLDFNL